VHFAGSGDMAGHTFFADFQAMAFGEDGASDASSSGRHHEFAPLGVVKIEADFDVADRCGNFVNDSGNEFVEVEGGGDSMREFLQTDQIRELLRGCFRRRGSGKTEFRERRRSHEKTLLGGVETEL
jgi:hypothetical protein